MTKDRIESMDILKGIAIAMVIVVHFVARLPELNPVIMYLGLYGQMGCQLFFVISAFFMCISYKRISGNGGNITFEFLKKKIMRLMPAYIIAIFVHIPVIILMRDCLKIEMNWPGTDLLNIIANIFFIQHLGIERFEVLVTGSWYIFCLILFYILFYIERKYLRIVRRENINKLILLSVLLEVLIGIALGGTENNSYYYTSIIVQLPVLLLGVKLYYEQERKYNIFLCAVLTFLGYISSLYMFFCGWKYAFLFVGLLAGGAFYGLIVLVRSWSAPKVGRRNLCVRCLSKMGNYSYELLFMHIYPVSYGTRIIRVLLEKVGIHLSGTVLFLILIIPMFLCSFLMAMGYRYVVDMIEKKLLRRTLK